MFSRLPLLRFSLLRSGGVACVAGGLALADHHRRSAECADQSGYDVKRQLGEGAFATVRLATQKSTGEEVAIKYVHKAGSEKAAVEKEVSILRAAGRHRHIVSLLDAFETKEAYALVLELVQGGEVFDRIVDYGTYSERDAATVVREVAAALEHLHARGICHRDLKPENLLLVTKKPNADVKLCDFGLAGFTGEGAPPLSGRNGTVAYMAPEMLASRLGSGNAYGVEVDSWALGIIMFILLSGFHPFDPQGKYDDAALERAVKRNAWDFKDPAFKHVSAEAKALIRRLLQPDPEARATVAEVLATPWVSKSAPATPLPSSTAGQLKAFNDVRRTWRAAIRAAALVGKSPAAAGAAKRGGLRREQLPPEALEELREAFAAYDVDGNGSIDLQELQQVMRSMGAADGQAEAALRAADVRGTGAIDFDAFVAAVGPVYAHSEAALRRAFQLFDADGNGFIDRGELRTMLLKLRLLPPDTDRAAQQASLERMFALADADGNGVIGFDEFVKIFSEGARPTGS